MFDLTLNPGTVLISFMVFVAYIYKTTINSDSNRNARYSPAPFSGLFFGPHQIWTDSNP